MLSLFIYWVILVGLWQVYTVAQESNYLIVQGIPALGLLKDLIKEFMAYGAIDEYRLLDDYPAEEFTEVLLVKFVKMQSARLIYVHYS